MTSPLFSPLVERAMRVAAVAHRHQRRKSCDLPYLTHPASVALILAQAGFIEETILAAALLHDVVEDTPVTLAELAGQFPPQVVEYVAALTEQKLDEQGQKRPWEVRKADHIQHISQAPVAARAIALADKLHNLGTIHSDLVAGTDVWSRFGASMERVLDYHRRMIDAAAGTDPELRPLAEAGRRLLNELERGRSVVSGP